MQTIAAQTNLACFDESHIRVEIGRRPISERGDTEIASERIGKRCMIFVSVGDDHRHGAVAGEGAHDGLFVAANSRSRIDYEGLALLTDDPGVGSGSGERPGIRSQHSLNFHHGRSKATTDPSGASFGSIGSVDRVGAKASAAVAEL